MSYLTCPSCRFSVAASAATSPLQNCPRCLLRENVQIVMIAAPAPRRRFARPDTEFERIAEAKARLAAVRPLGSA